MPAKKSARQSLTRYHRNRPVRRATRTAVAEALRAVEVGELTEAEAAVAHAISLLDRAVKKGVLPKNNASRHKSRLALKLGPLRGVGTS